MTRAVSVAGPGGVCGGASVVVGQAGVESSGPRVRRQWWRGVASGAAWRRASGAWRGVGPGHSVASGPSVGAVGHRGVGPGWSGGGAVASALSRGVRRRGGGAPVCVRAFARCGVDGGSDERRRVCLGLARQWGGGRRGAGAGAEAI